MKICPIILSILIEEHHFEAINNIDSVSPVFFSSTDNFKYTGLTGKMPGYLLLSCLRYDGCQGHSFYTLPALIVQCHIHTILERSREKGLLQSYL